MSHITISPTIESAPSTTGSTHKNKPLIITIEGNIGSGKSSILHHLEKYYSTTINTVTDGLYSNVNTKHIVFLKEPVDEWSEIRDGSGETILAKFYRDPAKYAFAFQVMAYATRLSILRKTLVENPECRVLICERSLEADKHIFANMLHDDGLIDDVCYQIYCRNFCEYASDFSVDKIVYIDADPEVCYGRIAKRSRTGESSIELDYLKKCAKYHDAWLLDNSCRQTPLLHLNTNADVKYDMTDALDLGISWIKQIVDFI